MKEFMFKKFQFKTSNTINKKRKVKEILYCVRKNRKTSETKNLNKNTKIK